MRSTLFLFVLLAIRIGAYLAPARMSGLSLDAYPGRIRLSGAAGGRLDRHRQPSRVGISPAGLRTNASARTDRRGLAVLLEMARSWPRMVHGLSSRSSSPRETSCWTIRAASQRIRPPARRRVDRQADLCWCILVEPGAGRAARHLAPSIRLPRTSTIWSTRPGEASGSRSQNGSRLGLGRDLVAQERIAPPSRSSARTRGRSSTTRSTPRP